MYYEVNINEQYAELVKCTVQTNIINIPETINYNNKNYKIIAIGPNVFRNNTNLTAITMTNNITNIGNNCFDG